ncbi:hypothetical protein D3C71_1163840 [compost metagenome]
MAHNYRLKYRVFVVLEMVLLQNGHALARRNMHVAGVSLDFAGQNFQERRFAGAVGSDQTVAVPGSELYIYIFKKCAFSVTESHAACTDHVFIPSFTLRFPAYYSTKPPARAAKGLI